MSNNYYSNYGTVGSGGNRLLTQQPPSSGVTPWAQQRIDEREAQRSISVANAFNIAASSISQVVMAAIATDRAIQMDKLAAQMRMDEYEYKKAARAQSLRQSVFFNARNRQRLDEAQASEQLAMGIEHMKRTATVANASLAGGVDNASAVVMDVQKQQMRAELYQKRTHINEQTNLSIQSLEAARNNEILYEPLGATSSSGAWAEFGVSALTVGEAAYSKFIPAKE